jgi:Sec-independent protein translocase protein TatA
MADTNKLIIGAVTILVIAAVAYGVLTMPDKRNAMEKIGDAIHDLPKGADKAERQLEDRTPGQKLGDAVKDAGDKIKDNTNTPTTSTQ